MCNYCIRKMQCNVKKQTIIVSIKKEKAVHWTSCQNLLITVSSPSQAESRVLLLLNTPWSSQLTQHFILNIYGQLTEVKEESLGKPRWKQESRLNPKYFFTLQRSRPVNRFKQQSIFQRNEAEADFSSLLSPTTINVLDNQQPHLKGAKFQCAMYYWELFLIMF